MKRCIGCGKPIWSDWDLVGNDYYHPECIHPDGRKLLFIERNKLRKEDQESVKPVDDSYERENS